MCAKHAQAEPHNQKIWLSIHQRNFSSHMTVRPSVHLSVHTTVQPM